MERGPWPGSPTPQLRGDVDVAAVVRDVMSDMARSTLADHPTAPELPETAIARVDPDQFRQVLFNLLSNAAKFSAAGLEIVVALRRRDDELVLHVRDRGHGVAPDDAERIFDQYERVDESVPGTGLGLYLSRRIARAHGGELRLVPAEGEGALFELALPVAGPDAD